MNKEPLKSPNQLPLHTDWERYETPAVVRKHGRQFLDRMWDRIQGESGSATFERITEAHGGRLYETEDATLLFFDDPNEAAECARKLRETGQVLSIAAQLSVKRVA
ncbi:hypothetical protein [Methylocaldum szegediense]|jgi:hypothetical protein|uniref:hypothetical protein n=1 Tax=Methylocaldum szegediense TaxID=73780 RepID=UPI00041AC16E|nr:hypothetical protein [Methylocaldum szegediense]